MSKLIWAINASLDGFADHTVGIGVDDDLLGFFCGLLDDTDLVAFGRVTYQLMEAAWSNARENPNLTDKMLEFADKLNAIPKVVFSRTLDKADWNNSRLVHEGMVSEVTRLRQRPGKNILLDGISVAQEFMRRGMLDEYFFAVHPIVAGKGRRLIDSLRESAILRLIDANVLRSGTVVLHYENRENRN